MRIGVGAVLMLAAALCSAVAGEPAPELQLPVSFEKVWYRPGTRGGFGGAKEGGLLTLSEAGIEFSGKKFARLWSWDEVEMVSHGRMRGDIDTRWVVVGVIDAAGERAEIGFRDGRKLGYGAGTQKIFDTLAAALRSVGAGPWAVPPGFAVYDELLWQLTLAVPQGWSPHHLQVTALDGRPVWGRSWFTPVDTGPLRQDPDRLRAVLREIETGRRKGILLYRSETPKALDCDPKKPDEAPALLAEALERALDPLAVQSGAQTRRIEHRGCAGWRIDGVARAADGSEVPYRTFAVSDGVTLVMLQQRGAGDAAAGERFETVVDSLRLAVAD